MTTADRLTARQAAGAAQCSVRTVLRALHQYASDGERGLRGTRRGGIGPWRIAPADLTAWINHETRKEDQVAKESKAERRDAAERNELREAGADRAIADAKRRADRAPTK